ncbi:MAG: peptidylprolyl isomerase [Myxococcales bacterium]|nr:MAG: peptidylprolyl isomerase [Myxococcales bacterium]
MSCNVRGRGSPGLIYHSRVRSPVRRTTIAALLVLPLLSACGDGEETTADPDGTCAYGDATAEAAKDVSRPAAEPDPDAPTEVTISTDRGAIKVALDPDKAPCTVNSFLHLADEGYFDNTQCHRLVTSGIFVLQCGDPTATGSGGPGYQFDDELLDNDPRLTNCGEQQTPQGPISLCTYPAGTVAMANAGPGTNGSQFFLVYKDSPLPPAYTVFGRMSAGGLSVVSKVAKDGVDTNGVAPKTSVTITGVK